MRHFVHVFLSLLLLVTLSLANVHTRFNDGGLAYLLTGPAFAQDSSSDPVVRGLNEQTGKLINGLIEKYGDGGAANQRKAADEARDALKKLEKDSEKLTDEAQENVLAYLLNGLQKLLSVEDMCALFKKYRGKGGKFHTSKSEYWWQADQFIKKHCPEKAPSPKGGGVKCRDGYPTIFDCVQEHNCKLQIIGDGTTTSQCQLQITNPRSGSVSTAQLHTVCVSNKTKKPPATQGVATNEGIAYSLGTAPPEIKKIIEASKSLNGSGAYDKVSLPAEKRAETISQLSIWKQLGDKSADPADKITSQTIETDLLRKAKINRKSLPSAEKKEIDRRVNEIFNAVDLTCKKANETTSNKEPDEPGQPGEAPQSDSPRTSTRSEEPKNQQSTSSDRLPPKPSSQTTFSGEVTDLQGPEEKICIPPYTVFQCNNEKYQDMMTVSESITVCPPAVLSASDVLPSQGTGPNQTLPNAAPSQSNSHNCCIQSVEVLNDTNQPVVYQLTNENDTPRKILQESSFVSSGSTRVLGEIRQSQVDVVAYVPGVVGGTVFHYQCQGVGQFTVQTNLSGLKTLKITTIECLDPVIVTAPTTPGAGLPGTNTATNSGTNTPPQPNPGGTSNPSPPSSTNNPTAPGTTQSPSTTTGTPRTTRTTPSSSGPSGQTGAKPPGSGGSKPSITTPPTQPKQNGKKKDGEQQQTPCSIQTINLKNDYKKPVVYTAYKVTENGIQSAELASSPTIGTGETTVLRGKFGERVRVLAKDASVQNARPIAIQEYSCERPGEQSIASDYDAFHQVTVVSGR